MTGNAASPTGVPSPEPGLDEAPPAKLPAAAAGDASWASTPSTRKAMQGNRSRDTKPEVRLRKALHAAGLRYRVCARPLPDVRRTVDISFGPSRVAVEVRGCFWHGCPQHYRAPAANGSYWAAKVQRNIARDRDTERRLAAAGWHLVVMWEHDDPLDTAAAIAEMVTQRRRTRWIG